MLGNSNPRLSGTLKAAWDCRTPRRFRVLSGATTPARLWSAAVLCRFGWPRRCFGTGSQIMQNTFAMVVIAWLAVVSLLVVAYLTSLTIEEKRRNRRMNAQRQRLGLSV